MASTGTFNAERVREFVNGKWDAEIVPKLSEYIAIPNQSPAYDPEWETNGYLTAAVDLIVNWIKAQNVAGLELEVLSEPGRTPLIYMTVPASAGVPADHTVLLYGHCDKQPPMTETWAEGLHPYKPVIRDGKLYGRGGADDGYASFASITAIKALQETGVAHARCVILIEAAEESGSDDLPYYVEKLLPRIGVPSLVICLDSGAGNYEQMWVTTSLRGVAAVVVDVKILDEGTHSGAASGVVPSSFRIWRQLLSRIEDENTGVMAPEFQVEIPEARLAQAAATVETLGDIVWSEFSFTDGAHPPKQSNLELYLNKTWRPTLSVTGAAGMPPPERAGNVLRTNTTLKLSIRLPPTADPDAVIAHTRKVLTENPPYGAKISVLSTDAAGGWAAPAEAPYLTLALDEASRTFYGKPAMYLGEGGTIPFMGMLSARFSKASFVITGVLGPKSNAHGPNEFIDIEYAKKLNGAVAQVIAVHAQQRE
eukprot:a841445_154.p1 GENE.a841445_154~~a841445_154.p1  ORF type:complete len:492 (+),score=205.60 a841445_154:36-1478(+)